MDHHEIVVGTYSGQILGLTSRTSLQQIASISDETKTKIATLRCVLMHHSVPWRCEWVSLATDEGVNMLTFYMPHVAEHLLSSHFCC